MVRFSFMFHERFFLEKLETTPINCYFNSFLNDLYRHIWCRFSSLFFVSPVFLSFSGLYDDLWLDTYLVYIDHIGLLSFILFFFSILLLFFRSYIIVDVEGWT